MTLQDRVWIWAVAFASQLFCINSEASPSILSPPQFFFPPLCPGGLPTEELLRGEVRALQGFSAWWRRNGGFQQTRRWLTANVMVTLPRPHPTARQEHTLRPLWPHSPPSAQLAAKAVPTTTCWQSRVEMEKAQVDDPGAAAKRNLKWN